ncbi:MAG: GTP 3',8-cyclase MoaA [Acidobacteriota bacterium]
MSSAVLRDLFGRRARTLRLSVTDRCNFRCTYCMPTEDMTWFPKEGILSFEEIHRVVGLLLPAGIERLRLTGGEPTLRSGLPELVSVLAALDGVASLSMTTNGVTMPRLGPALHDAGLQGVTISLDTLHPRRFEQLTRRDALGEVFAGIDAAIEAGFDPVKINVVTLRGVNDDELVDFAQFARMKGVAVRFIEYMPLDGGSGWGPERVLPGAEAKATIEAAFPLRPRRERPEAPARPYVFADEAPGEVGFINPVTEPFCARCDRLRLTADGKLKNCMFDEGEVDLMGPLRDGASDDELIGHVLECVKAKGPGGLIELKPAEAYSELRNMSRLGG